MEQENKKDIIVNNEAFKERFQFLVLVNENIICQRYFRIRGFNSDSLVSEELHDTLEECVGMIKRDLWHKSFLYQDITKQEPMKINGFLPDVTEYSDLVKMVSHKHTGNVELSDGRVVFKEYIEFPENTEDVYVDNELLKPYEVTFKFMFLVDDKPVYERIWDGTVYPRQVRNSVDLSNSGAICDHDKIVFSTMDNIIRYLKCGKQDLLYHMIKKLCECMSGGFDDPNAYTKSMEYGCKTYSYSTYNKKFVNGYAKWVMSKTKNHIAELERAEKYKETGGLTPGEWKYIENYL